MTKVIMNKRESGVPLVSRPTRPLWGINPLENESDCLEP